MLAPIQNQNKILRYKPTSIDEEKLDEVLYAALHSPSEHGNRDWEVVTVTKPELKNRLALATPDAFFVNTAPVVLTMCSPEWDRWIEDISTAEENIYLEALNQGLGPNLVHVRDNKTKNGISSEQYIRDLLQVPENMRVHSLMPLGYPEEIESSQDPVVLNMDKLHREGW